MKVLILLYGVWFNPAQVMALSEVPETWSQNFGCMIHLVAAGNTSRAKIWAPKSCAKVAAEINNAVSG